MIYNSTNDYDKEKKVFWISKIKLFITTNK